MSDTIEHRRTTLLGADARRTFGKRLRRMRRDRLLGDEARTQFGRRLRQLRQEQGLSQEDLGGRADLDRNYVGGIERGERNPSLVNICRIAGALGIEVTELLEGVPAIAPDA
jgi:ribosome-binding protein aMBF1 (putative translation factor)